MGQGEDPGITLFHYTFSPYAKRVVWYLNLRGIKYDQCLQSHMMPRPDLAALGVQYRRIPVLAIGRDIYCDSRLILEKLEELYPEGALGARANDNDAKALEKLLDIWTTDGGVFARAAELIPPDTPMTSDSKFIADRQDFSGRSWAKDDVMEKRREALAHIKLAFNLLETTLLADGRKWVLRDAEEPTLADIKTMWVLDWVAGLKGDDKPEHISEVQYPKVFAWMARFREKITTARAAMPKPKTVSGADALARLQTAGYAEQDGSVDETDPLKLRRGQEVIVWPTDSGSNYRGTGRLVGLSLNEVVLQRRTEDRRTEVRVHFPRTNFRIVAAEEGPLGAGARL